MFDNKDLSNVLSDLDLSKMTLRDIGSEDPILRNNIHEYNGFIFE
jgi:hypothetical protein